MLAYPSSTGKRGHQMGACFSC